MLPTIGEIDAGNWLAVIVGLSGLALGAWDRVNNRKKNQDDDENRFRGDILKRLAAAEAQRDKMFEKLALSEQENARMRGELTMFRHCGQPKCPFKAHILVNEKRQLPED